MIEKKRPKCQIPGCDKDAQLHSSIAKWKFRKSSWVAEKYDCEGYICMKHHSIHYGMLGWEYRIHRKDYCENIDGRLGFKCTTTIIDVAWQLDADHIDGNPTHNNAENIQTLCKCCHAIKTRDEKDYLTDGRKTLSVKAVKPVKPVKKIV